MTDEIRTCLECGEEFESENGEEFCEICIAYGELESMDYGG